MLLETNKKLKISLVIIIVFIIIFGLNKIGANQIRDVFFRISYSFQKNLWGVGEKLSFDLEGFFRIKDLKKENEEFKKLNFFFIQKLAELKDVESENKELREALGLNLEKTFILDLVHSVSRDINSDSLLIDKGQEHGMKKGMPIINAQSILIGKIGEVFSEFSEVIVISNKDIVFDVEVLNQEEFYLQSLSKILGIVKGNGDYEIDLQLIPRDAQIKQGDIVITSRLGGNFPPGLLVGAVKNIDKSDTDPFQEGEITPYFLEIKLETLFVIKDRPY